MKHSINFLLASQRAAVACGGHQPAAVIKAADRADLLRGHQVALRAWSAAGADLVLRGERSTDPGKDCRIEQWDYAINESAFVPTLVKVEPER